MVLALGLDVARLWIDPHILRQFACLFIIALVIANAEVACKVASETLAFGMPCDSYRILNDPFDAIALVRQHVA